jgi:4-amino-4-deoxy-L-arabinose transferase-like glycosyltransferase
MTQTTPQRQNKKAFIHQIVPEILLVLLLLAAAVLRFSGIDWGEGQFLHPDEGFLTTVESRLVPVQSLGEYWDTANSTLNPHNSGYTFFVYGTLPIFLVRYVATWLGQTGWGDLMVVGRNISALADLGVIFLVYLTAVRLFDRRVGLFAAAFAAFSVLPIQLSHYFAVDTFLAAFTMLSIYFAVCLATDQPAEGKYFRPRYFVYFGLALGMAVATKINIVPVALVLPLAVWVRISKLERKDWGEAAWVASGYLLLAAFVSVLTFRIFQPYAFTGPGFFGILPNRMWLDSISDLLNQVSGDFDWPPSIQWARRPIWYSFQHMVLWGMGLPMGILA